MLLSELFEKKDSGGGTAWVILYTPDKVILGKRSPAVNNPNQWGFFGGHIDEGETPAKAAARELFEETTMKVSSDELKQIATIGPATYFTYKVTGGGSLKTTTEVSKIQQYRISQLPDNVHAKAQNFFDKLVDLL